MSEQPIEHTKNIDAHLEKEKHAPIETEILHAPEPIEISNEPNESLSEPLLEPLENTAHESTPEPIHTQSHDSLHELNHLIEECNDTIEMLKEHHDLQHHESDKHVQHSIDEMRAEVMHMEEARHHAAHSEKESEKESQAEFFNHHAESLHHANEHWLHLQHHMEIMFEEIEAEELEELLEIKERMKHLLKEIAREEAEKKNEAEHSAPHPEMHAMHGDD